MDLFTYGTLRAKALMAAVAGPGPLDAVPARLSGYAVHAVRGDVVPFIAPQAGAEAEGLLWRGLTPAQMLRLDAYEGAFGYGFQTVTVETAVGPAQAQAYIPPPDVFEGDATWSLDAWEKGHLVPAILAAEELFSHDPLPDYPTLRAMWPMIEARAWSKFRAAGAQALEEENNDFAVSALTPPQGRFFRFQAFEVDHRTFNGGRSGPMRREAFWGIDAAIVLPYDPLRDRVLFVEQARIGPRLRRDRNPWVLEPIAGIVDARETPADAALREAEEEAGLADVTLLDAGSFYVSPGATTDYFYSFVGLCDLPQDQPYRGGLDAEGEDLKLHPMGFSEAIALADQGGIPTGPALFLLNWLARHRDRLRAEAEARGSTAP